MLDMVIWLFSSLLKLSGIAFFFYMVYEGTVGGQGSSSVFIGTGILAMITVGGHFIDKFGSIK